MDDEDSNSPDENILLYCQDQLWILTFTVLSAMSWMWMGFLLWSMDDDDEDEYGPNNHDNDTVVETELGEDDETDDTDDAEQQPVDGEDVCHLTNHDAPPSSPPHTTAVEGADTTTTPGDCDDPDNYHHHHHHHNNNNNGPEPATPKTSKPSSMLLPLP